MSKRIAATLLVGLTFFPIAAHADAPAQAPSTQPQSSAAPPTSQPAQPIDPVGDAALAERLTQMAQATLTFRTINQTTFQEAASLLKAATVLYPGEPRYARLLAEAYLQLGDRPGAIDALKTLCGVDPNDQIALIKLLDLYGATMQSADAKLAYFQQKLAIDSLPGPVRGHIAYRCAQLMIDRGQNAEAKDMIVQALKYNSADPDALELNERITRNGKPDEHAGALLALLMGNPAQPAVMSELASELADQGLTSESAGWYANSVSTSNRLSVPSNPQTYADYISEVMIAGQSKASGSIADSLLASDPYNESALYLKMLANRKAGDADATAKALDGAIGGFCEHVYESYRRVTKTDPPSTQPTGELKARLGDIDAVTKSVVGSKDPASIAYLGSALTDLAWTEIYFAGKPEEAAPLMPALHTLLPADDVRLSRLEGWSLLVSKKPDEAKVKLSAVAARDPISQMGMIRILAANPAQKDAATKQAKALVDANPSGLVCVMLMDGLKDQGGTTVDITDAGNTIKKMLSTFPRGIFDILDKPESFYQIHCDPQHVPHAFDDPMLALVTISNISPVPLTIGAKGIIHPDLWFDVQLRGINQQNLPGVAYDRIAERTVLQPGESTRQVIRLDQPKLAATLANNPLIATQLSFTMVTNPTSSSTGIGPGPAGQRQLVQKVLIRESTPLTPENQKQIQQTLAQGSGDMKVRTISLVATFARGLAASTDAEAQKRAKQLIDALTDLGNDPSPSVAAWAQYQCGMARPADQRPDVLKQMVSAPGWQQRLLGASLALGIGGQPGKEALDTLAKDDDPIVKKYAATCVYDMAHPTTQPASSQPTIPAAAPAPAP